MRKIIILILILVIALLFWQNINLKKQVKFWNSEAEWEHERFYKCCLINNLY